LLAGWFRTKPTLTIPWLRGATRWQVLVAATLLDRSTPEQVRQVWSMLQMWREPGDTLKNASVMRAIGTLSRRTDRIDAILALAQALAQGTYVMDDDAILELPGIGRPVAQLALLAAPVAIEVPESSGSGVESPVYTDRGSLADVGGQEISSEEPVLARAALLRVAARYTGEPVDIRNRLTDGRLAVARMIGGGADAREAQLGLVELAATLCRPTGPLCSECPLRPTCRGASVDDTLLSHLA